MQENLFWTEKISLGTIRDPLQLAVFRYPDQYFLTGITTQTQRIRYYTFLTWAWNQIKEKKSDLKEKKILYLVMMIMNIITGSDLMVVTGTQNMMLEIVLIKKI